MLTNDEYTQLNKSFNLFDDIPEKQITETISGKIMFGDDEDANFELLSNLYDKLDGNQDVENIEELIKIYDREILVKFVVNYVIYGSFGKAEPIIEKYLGRPIIFDLIENKISGKKICKAKIDMCKLNKHNKTFLFYINDPEYLIKFLELDEIDSIIDYTVNGFTFFDFFQHNNYNITGNENGRLWLCLIMFVLKRRNFNFNTKHLMPDMSLLDRILMEGYHLSDGGLETACEIAKKCCIVSTNMFWINTLVKSCNSSCKITNTILSTILERDDYKTFIVDLVTFGTNENDILHIFSHLMLEPQIEEMLEAQNSLGSNVLHLLALKHYDVIIRLLYAKFGNEYMKTLNIKNVNGDLPSNLYNQYEIKNLLL